jgi:hypothetical protein
MLDYRAALIGLLLWSTSAALEAATPPAAPSLQPAALKADVAILEQTYRELHPGLQRYLSARQVDQAFAALRQELSRPRTVADAYLAFARFAAKIRCGHTYANFFNQSKEIKETLFEQSPRLPFYFRWIDGKMVVIRDFTDPAILPVGTEVTRINGVKSAVILAALLPLARADGGNDAKRIDQMNVTGDGVYESFDIYYPLLYPLKSGTVQLTLRPPTAVAERTITVNTLTYRQRIEPIRAREEARTKGTEPVFEWRDLDDGSAYLRMPTWAMYESKWEWRPWLDARLAALAARNARALIIDLRGNEGGEDVGDEVLKHIVNVDLPLAQNKRLVRYRAVPQDLLPYLDTWDPSFKDWGKDATELPAPWVTAPPVHYFALAGEDGSVDARTVIHPVQPHFGGRLFVLVDAANSSATFQFAQVVQQNSLGTLVGAPTGGNRRGINGGAFFFLHLPNSGIELDVPLIGAFPKMPQPDAGLIPDVDAPVTAASIAADVDPALEAVKQLLVQPR